MPWEVPITVGDDEYRVKFEGDTEPTEAEINAAVEHLKDPVRGQNLGEGITAGLEQGFQKGLTATFITGPGAVVEALGGGDNELLRAGRHVEKSIEEDSPISRENQKSYPVKAAQAVGQAGSMAVTAPLSGASQGFRAASMIGKARQIALMGGFAGAASGEEEATRLGITDPLAKSAMILGTGAIEFTSELAGGFSAELAPFRALAGKGGTRGFVKEALTEGGEEILAGVPQRGLAKALADEDPNNPGHTKEGQPIFNAWDLGQIVEEGSLGAIAGGALVSAHRTLSALTPQQQQDSRNVAGLPQQLRQAAFNALQTVSQQEQQATQIGDLVDPNTAAAMRVVHDGQRAQILEDAANEAKAKFAPGWQEREKATLQHTGEEADTFFEGGEWIVQSGIDQAGQPVFKPAANAEELEKARQDFIRTGELPEGMQPLVSQTPASVAPSAADEANEKIDQHIQSLQGLNTAATGPRTSPTVSPTSPTQAAGAPTSLNYDYTTEAERRNPEYTEVTGNVVSARQEMTTDEKGASTVPITLFTIEQPNGTKVNAKLPGHVDPAEIIGKTATVGGRHLEQRQGDEGFTFSSMAGTQKVQFQEPAAAPASTPATSLSSVPTAELPQPLHGMVMQRGLVEMTNKKLESHPFENSRWQLQAVPVAATAATGGIKPERYTGRKSQTKGPIAIAASGEVIDGNHRIAEALARGDATIDAFVEIPANAPATNAPPANVQPPANPEDKDLAFYGPYKHGEMQRVRQQYPNSPELVEGIQSATSDAAAKAFLDLAEPRAQLREELEQMTPMQIEERMRGEGVAEAQIARASSGGTINVGSAFNSILRVRANQPAGGVRDTAPKPRPERRRRMIPREILGDVMDVIEEHGGLISATEARAQFGEEWWEQNKSEYDGAPKLASPLHSFIYTSSAGGKGRLTPNQIANFMVQDKVRPPGYDVNDLWNEIERASKSRHAIHRQRAASEREQKDKEKQGKEFGKATAKGKRAITTWDAQPGDVLDIEGEPTTVLGIVLEFNESNGRARMETADGQERTIRIDHAEPGDLILEDGARFGRQILPEGKAIWIEHIERAGPAVEDEGEGFGREPLNLLPPEALAAGTLFAPEVPQTNPTERQQPDEFEAKLRQYLNEHELDDWTNEDVLEAVAAHVSGSTAALPLGKKTVVWTVHTLMRTPSESRAATPGPATLVPITQAEMEQRANGNAYAQGVWEAAQQIQQPPANTVISRDADGHTNIPELVGGAPFAITAAGMAVIVTDQVHVTLEDRRKAEDSGNTAPAEALKRVMGEAKRALTNRRRRDARAVRRDATARATVTEPVEEISAPTPEEQAQAELEALPENVTSQDLMEPGTAPALMTFARGLAQRVSSYAEFARRGVAALGRGFSQVSKKLWTAVQALTVAAIGFGASIGQESASTAEPRLQAPRPNLEEISASIDRSQAGRRLVTLNPGNAANLDAEPLRGMAIVDGISRRAYPTATSISLAEVNEMPGSQAKRVDVRGRHISRQTRKVADWVITRGDNNGAPFVVADKQAGTVAMFDSAGALVDVVPALFGKDTGDVGETGMRRTPAGRFVVNDTDIGNDPEGHLGTTIDLAPGSEGANVAIHRLYLEDSTEQRLARLASPDPRDNRISYGCINLAADVMDNTMLPLFESGGTVYILPETEQGRQTFQQTTGMRFSEARKRTLAIGVAASDVMAAKTALAKILPNVDLAWTGTRAQLETTLRGDPEFQRRWKDDWQQTHDGGTRLEANEAFDDFLEFGLDGREGFTVGGRTYIIHDQIAVTEADGSAAGAVRRVLIHEDAHEALDYLRGLNPEVETAWRGFRNDIAATELDDLAARLYPHLKDWRTDSGIHDDLAHEWLAAKIAEIEERGQPAPDSLIGKFLAWLRGIFKTMLGSNIDPDNQALLDFMDAARNARFQARENASRQGVRYSATNADGDIPPHVIANEINDQPPADVQIEPFRRPRYNLWSPTRQKAYAAFHSNPDLPEAMRHFTQFLGEQTDDVRITESLAPMVQMSNRRLGSIHGEVPEVNEENTALAYADAKAMASQKTFARKYIQEFQTWHAARDPRTGEPLHKGDAAVAVHQLNLIRYGIRLLAKTGDAKLWLQMQPFANDVILGDFATMTANARQMQARSVASRNGAGMPTALQLMHGAQHEAATKAMKDNGGEQAARDLAKSISGEEVQAEIRDGMTSEDETTAALDAALQNMGFESEGYRERGMELLDEQARAWGQQLDDTLKRLDELEQIRRAIAARKSANAARPSLTDAQRFAAELEKFEKDPVGLEKQFEAAKKRAKELLAKLTQDPTSHESKEKRRRRVKDYKHAVKALSTDEQARKLIERYTERNKRVKRDVPVWKALFDKQIQKPQSEETFTAAAVKEGITEETAATLFDLAETLKAERAERAREQRANRREATADERLERMGEQAAKEPTERQKTGKRLTAQSLILSIADQILRAPLSRQQMKVVRQHNPDGDPEVEDEATEAPPWNREWVRQAFSNAFVEHGIPRAEADAMADKLSGKWDGIMKNAQVKVATKACKALNVKKQTLEKITNAIRSTGIDPLNSNAVIKGLAEDAGFGGLTTADFQRLAQLDQIIADSLPTLVAKATTEVQRIIAKVKPPKHWARVMEQLFINGALGSLGVLSLNILHPTYILPRMLVTDLAGILGDAALAPGKANRAETLKLAGYAFQSLWRARYGMLSDAMFSLKNDAYQTRMIELLSVEHSLYKELMANWEKLTNGSVGERALALPKILWLSSDWVRRILSSADQMWGMVIQNYVIENEAMRQMVQEAGMDTGAAALIVNQAHKVGRDVQASHLSLTNDKAESVMVGRDAFIQSLSQGLNALIPATKERPGGGDRARVTAENTYQMELGNRRGEDAPWWSVLLLDPNNILEGVVKRPVSAMRNYFDKIGLPVGRAFTGFVSVAANIINRSYYLTPLGLARVLAKKAGVKTKNGEEIFKETMATDGMIRARMYEGIVSGFLLTLLALLKLKWKDEDEYFGITGNGPTNPGMREAWLKQGHKPGFIEFRNGSGEVVVAFPYTRGGFDHAALALTTIGAIDDLELDGHRPRKGTGANWAFAYGQQVIGNQLKQAQFYGIRAWAGAVPSSDKPHALAGQAGYLLNPWTPWGGLTKSIYKMYSGAQEQGSVASAFLSNMPIAQVITGQHVGPRLNYLGDQIGGQPDDVLKKMAERASYAGFPFYFAMDPRNENEDVYHLILEKGIAPSMPSRSEIESKYGWIDDETWAQYVTTRGGLIKTSIRRSMDRLYKLDPADSQREMEKISSQATRSAKHTMGWK